MIAPNFVHRAAVIAGERWVCETCGVSFRREPTKRQRFAHALSRHHQWASMLTERARAGWALLPGSVARPALARGVETEPGDEPFTGTLFVRLDTMESLEDAWRHGTSAEKFPMIRAAVELVRHTGLPWRLAWHQTLAGRDVPVMLKHLAGGDVWPWELGE